jgi:hypothetical protein
MTVALEGWRVAFFAWNNGFRGNDLITAVAVAKAESGWRTDARLLTSKEDSRGLWQINTFAHPNFNKTSLYEPNYNAGAARVVWNNAGGRWTPWTTYTRGTYGQFWGVAQAAVAQLGQPGGASQGVGQAPGTVVSQGVGVNVPVELQPYDPGHTMSDYANWLSLVGVDHQTHGDALASLLPQEGIGHA